VTDSFELRRHRRATCVAPAQEASSRRDDHSRAEGSKGTFDANAAVGDGAGQPAVGGSDLHRKFWLTHMRIGFGVFLVETLVVLAYLAITPHGPHRTLLGVIAMSWLLFAFANLLLANTVATRSWRSTFSASWTVLSAFAVVGVADLDGGMRSPLLLLLFLPISFAGWAFTPRAAAACGVSSVSSLGIVALTSPVSSRSEQTGLLLFAVLAGSSVLSIAAARNRARRDAHELELTNKIAQLAATDGLTGCAVHRVFHQRLREEVSRAARHERPLSLAMIDVDEFKRINDSYGHLIGDHVLAGIGVGLRSRSRSTDLVARLGGDEFAILMPETLPSVAADIVSRIRDEIMPGLEVAVTLSIGVSGLDSDVPTAEQLLDDADFALYEVKRGGRNSIAVRNLETCIGTGI
jgi:diguanylate cyclase (GGDEF)-like protein